MSRMQNVALVAKFYFIFIVSIIILEVSNAQLGQFKTILLCNKGKLVRNQEMQFI